MQTNITKIQKHINIRNTYLANAQGRNLFESLVVGQTIRVTRRKDLRSKTASERYRGEIEQKYPNIIIIRCNGRLRSLPINDFITEDYIIEIIR